MPQSDVSHDEEATQDPLNGILTKLNDKDDLIMLPNATDDLINHLLSRIE